MYVYEMSDKDVCWIFNSISCYHGLQTVIITNSSKGIILEHLFFKLGNFRDIWLHYTELQTSNNQACLLKRCDSNEGDYEFNFDFEFLLSVSLHIRHEFVLVIWIWWAFLLGWRNAYGCMLFIQLFLNRNGDMDNGAFNINLLN